MTYYIIYTTYHVCWLWCCMISIIFIYSYPTHTCNMYIYIYIIHREKKGEIHSPSMCPYLWDLWTASGRTYEKGQTNVATARVQVARRVSENPYSEADKKHRKSGWWFGTWILFSPIIAMMIQSDKYISKGVETTNQKWNFHTLAQKDKELPSGKLT